jgi:O-antigen/teichoic acid export membrane protein
MTLKARFLALAWQLRVAVMVIFAEALATSVVTVFFVVALVTDAKLVGTLIALCVVIGGTAAFLFFVSRQLVYRKRWARSAAVFWQLIQIAIAWNSFTGEVLGYYFGVWLLATAFVALYFLFNKRVVELTDEQIDRD